MGFKETLILATTFSLIASVVLSPMFANGSSAAAEEKGRVIILNVQRETSMAIDQVSENRRYVKIGVGTSPELSNVTGEIIDCDTEKLSDAPLGLIEPMQRRYVYPIGGSLNPGIYDYYGPFGATISIEIYVSWTPTNQVCGVGIIDNQTGVGPAQILYGGSGHAAWSTNLYSAYWVIIFNPSPPNTQAITYSGQIVVWRL